MDFKYPELWNKFMNKNSYLRLCLLIQRSKDFASVVGTFSYGKRYKEVLAVLDIMDKGNIIFEPFHYTLFLKACTALTDLKVDPFQACQPFENADQVRGKVMITVDCKLSF